MVYDWLADRPFDPQNPRARGVTADRLVVTREGHRMRIIGYADPVSGEAHEFLANGMDRPAGVLAELDRRRWSLEEVFDGSKNELGEKKAWGTTLAAKGAQGQLVALTHELLRRYEERLEREQGVTNTAADDRRQEQNREAGRTARRAGPALSPLPGCTQRATRRSVKFIRRLRQPTPWKTSRKSAP